MESRSFVPVFVSSRVEPFSNVYPPPLYQCIVIVCCYTIVHPPPAPAPRVCMWEMRLKERERERAGGCSWPCGKNVALCCSLVFFFFHSLHSIYRSAPTRYVHVVVRRRRLTNVASEYYLFISNLNSTSRGSLILRVASTLVAWSIEHASTIVGWSIEHASTLVAWSIKHVRACCTCG